MRLTKEGCGRLALWVRHDAVEAHLRRGWVVAVPDRFCSHDLYSVLLIWLCDCEAWRAER
jgi:hypothetical protein